MKSAMINEQTLMQHEKRFIQTMSKQAIVERINAIILELEMLRAMITIPATEQPEINLTDKLFGALGKGSWAEYNNDLDWMRFDT